jgi:hypothetical protein
MVEVYGRREDGTLWFIGYAETKPGAEWCDQHVSSVMGSFKSVEWSAVHAAWIIDMNALENKAIESAAVGEETRPPVGHGVREC